MERTLGDGEQNEQQAGPVGGLCLSSVSPLLNVVVGLTHLQVPSDFKF